MMMQKLFLLLMSLSVKKNKHQQCRHKKPVYDTLQKTLNSLSLQKREKKKLVATIVNTLISSSNY